MSGLPTRGQMGRCWKQEVIAVKATQDTMHVGLATQPMGLENFNCKIKPEIEYGKRISPIAINHEIAMRFSGTIRDHDD